MKRKRVTISAFVLLVAAIAAVMVVSSHRRELWWAVAFSRVPWAFKSDPDVPRGYYLVPRWRDAGALWHLDAPYGVQWSPETGFKVREQFKDDAGLRITYWNKHGAIVGQTFEGRVEEVRHRPPWLWGVIDQTEPSAPWTNREECDRWWRALPRP